MAAQEFNRTKLLETLTNIVEEMQSTSESVDALSMLNKIRTSVQKLPKIDQSKPLSFHNFDKEKWRKFLCLVHQYRCFGEFSARKRMIPLIDTITSEFEPYCFKDLMPDLTLKNYAIMMSEICQKPTIYEHYLDWKKEQKKAPSSSITTKLSGSYMLLPSSPKDSDREEAFKELERCINSFDHLSTKEDEKVEVLQKQYDYLTNVGLDAINFLYPIKTNDKANKEAYLNFLKHQTKLRRTISNIKVKKGDEILFKPKTTPAENLTAKEGNNESNDTEDENASEEENESVDESATVKLPISPKSSTEKSAEEKVEQSQLTTNEDEDEFTFERFGPIVIDADKTNSENKTSGVFQTKKQPKPILLKKTNDK